MAAAVAVLTALAGWGLTRLGFDDNPRGVFRSDDKEFRLLEELFAQFGTDDNNCFLLVRSSELFSAVPLDDLRRLVREVERIDGVENVVSLTDERLLLFGLFLRGENAKQSVLAHPLVAGQLVSKDGEYALITVRLRGEALAIKDIQPVHEALSGIARRYTSETSLEVFVSGIPSIRVVAFNLVQQESQRFTLLCAAAAFLMAGIILRRWQMVVVVCAAALSGALWSAGALGIIGEDITVLTVVLPMLVMVVGFTDAVHLAVDVRHSRADGLPPPLCARESLRHLTVACALTSFTTAAGFASLGVTQTEIIRRFGWACGLGAVLTFVAVITIVPLLASTRLGIGMLPPRGGIRIGAAARTAGSWLIDFVLRWRWPIAVAGALLSLAMAAAVFQLEPENQISETLPDNAPEMAALQLVDQHFGGIMPSFVAVDWPKDVDWSSPRLKAALQDVHQVCGQHPAVGHPFSLLNFIRAVPGQDLGSLPEAVRQKLKEATQKLAREDLRRAVVHCRSPDRGAAYYANTFPSLAEKLRELEQKHDGFRFRLTGSSVVVSRNLDQMIRDLASSLCLASVVIFVTLTLVFRSIRIGLICLVPNALPLLLTATLLVLMGEPLRFSSVIVFCVCLGIAVDDTIHVINRFQRELKETGDVDQALRRSLRAVGSALIITTLVLLVGFSVTLTSAIPGNRMFGMLSCVAIAAALVGDLVVLPALLACFVRRPNQDLNSRAAGTGVE